MRCSKAVGEAGQASGSEDGTVTISSACDLKISHHISNPLNKQTVAEAVQLSLIRVL